MAEREISVVMESTYKSDLVKGLEKDRTRLKWEQRRLKRNPLIIPVKLDISGAKIQLADLHKTMLGEMAKISRPGIVGADGRSASSDSSELRKIAEAAGKLKSVTSKTFGKDGVTVTSRTLSEVEQIGNGLERISRFKLDAQGNKSGKISEIEKNVSTVKELEDRLRSVNKTLGQAYASAQGRGDKAGQIAALQEQKRRVNGYLEDAATGGLSGSAAYTKGESQLDRLNSKIAGLEGRQESDAQKTSRKERARAVGNQITEEQSIVKELLKINKLEMDGTERIKDKATRLAEVNRLYDERRKIFEDSKVRMGNLDIALQGEGRHDQGDRANRARLGMQSQVRQADLDQSRAETDRLRIEEREQARVDKANQATAARAKRLADQAAARSGKRNFNRSMRLDEHATTSALTQNDSQIAAAKALPDRLQMEAELNRLLAAREQIYRDSATRLGTIRKTQGLAGNADNAARAESAKLKADENAGKVIVSQTKADSDAAIAARRKAAADQKKQDTKDHADRESSFKREMQDINRRSEGRIAQINQDERAAKRAAGKDSGGRQLAAQTGHSLRQDEYNNRATAYDNVEQRARSAGHITTADNARSKRLGAEITGAKDMERFADATTKSGHALNFHASNMLRNAASFMKWQLAMTAVMAPLKAISEGIAGAVRIDRQFATLQAVFRGTADEARRLKGDVLELASANGRSGAEAMDAAIRWSRLGLSRVQINQAVETSLIAANVAEISTAEAAEKLAAIYATYSLTISDLPVVIGRLNAISNRYNVTNNDLLEGISRVAGVAKQAGLGLSELEGLIGAATGASGRSGAEMGNALKFIITRISDPTIIEKLRSGFNLDLKKPNGEIMAFGDILEKLAQKFPTLGASGKAALLSITSGSRQAARMALILDQYRQSQILSAEAAFDSASAFSENEKILNSVQSRVESLKSAWEDLFVTMGDAGAYERVGGFFKYLRGLVDAMKDSFGEAQELGKEPITIKDPRKAEAIERFGPGENKWFDTRTKFSKEEVDGAIKKLEEGLAYQKGNNPLKFLDRDVYGGFSMEGQWGESKGFDSMEDAEKFIAEMKDLREQGGDTRTADHLTRITAEIGEAREGLRGLEESSGVFDGIAHDIEAGGKSREAMLRDFENASNLILRLSGGQNILNEETRDYAAAMEKGDLQGAAAVARRVSHMFGSEIPAAKAKLDTERVAKLKELNDEAAKLQNDKRTALTEDVGGDPEKFRERSKKLEQIKGNLKAVADQIRFVNGEIAAAERKYYPWDNMGSKEMFKENLSDNSRSGTIGHSRAGRSGNGAMAFKTIAEDLEKGGKSSDEILQNFKNTQSLMGGITNGAELFSDALREFQQALDAGDSGVAGAVASGMGKRLDAARIIQASAATRGYRDSMAELNAQLGQLAMKEAEVEAADPGFNPEEATRKAKALEELASQMDEVTAAMAKLSEQQKTVTLGMDTKQLANVTKYFDAITNKAAAVASTLDELAPAGSDDPVERQFMRRRAAAGRLLEMLEETSRLTREEAAKMLPGSRDRGGSAYQDFAHPNPDAERKAGLMIGKPFTPTNPLAPLPPSSPDTSNPFAETGKRPPQMLMDAGEAARRSAFVEHEVELQNQSVKLAAEKTRAEAEALRIKIEQLDYEEKLASIARTQTDAGRRAGNSSLAYRFGATESDKDANQAAAVMERAKKRLGQASAIWFNEPITGSNPKARADLKGSILQDEVTARTDLESMERRQFELEAARKQVGIDLLKNLREQTEEASKRLALASREDQLRAAALARTLRDKGPVKDREFFALSQESRQAFQNFLPNAAPNFLNEAKVTAAKTIIDIGKEQTRLTSDITALKPVLDSLTKAITAASGKGGPLDVAPNAPASSVQGASRDKSPLVNVNVGDVAVNVTLNKEVEGIMQRFAVGILKAEIIALETRLTRPPAPNSNGVSE